MQLKGLIFDNDGTLIENMPYHIKAFSVQAERHGYTLKRQIDDRYFGWGNEEIMPEVIPEPYLSELGLQFLSIEKEAIYREIYGPVLSLQAGLEQLLEEAHSLGLKSIVGSAGPRPNVELVMDRAGLYRWMDGYICKEDVTRCKPDPQIFLTAAQRMGLRPEECLVFEDAPSGIKAAHAAGMKCAVITTTTPLDTLRAEKPDLLFDSFQDLSIRTVAQKLGFEISEDR